MYGCYRYSDAKDSGLEDYIKFCRVKNVHRALEKTIRAYGGVTTAHQITLENIF